MSIKAKRIYWTQTEPPYYFGGQSKPTDPAQSFALAVVVAQGQMFDRGIKDRMVDELRELCPEAPSDDILIGTARAGTAFQGCIIVHYSTILQKGACAGWESIEGSPDFI